MATHYGHVAPMRLATEGTLAAAASGRAVAFEDDGDGDDLQARRRPRKTARFASGKTQGLPPRRLAEVTYDELVDLRSVLVLVNNAKRAGDSSVGAELEKFDAVGVDIDKENLTDPRSLSFDLYQLLQQHRPRPGADEGSRTEGQRGSVCFCS